MDHSPFAAVFRPGTRFAREFGGPLVVKLREIGALAVPSGLIVTSDPAYVDFSVPQRPFARVVPLGVFPVELALCFSGETARVACARVRFADEPAARWESAPLVRQGPDDQDPRQCFESGFGCFYDATARVPADAATRGEWTAAVQRNRADGWSWHVAELGSANVVMFTVTEGLGRSYWGFDEHDRLVELVTDFDMLRESIVDRLELPLPLPDGVLVHPWLGARGVTVSRPPSSPTTAVVEGPASVYLSETRMVMRERWAGDTCRYEWKHNAPGLRLVISVRAGERRLIPISGDSDD